MTLFPAHELIQMLVDFDIDLIGYMSLECRANPTSISPRLKSWRRCGARPITSTMPCAFQAAPSSISIPNSGNPQPLLFRLPRARERAMEQAWRQISRSDPPINFLFTRSILNFPGSCLLHRADHRELFPKSGRDWSARRDGVRYTGRSRGSEPYDRRNDHRSNVLDERIYGSWRRLGASDTETHRR